MVVRKAKMAVGLGQNLKGTCLKIERKKMEFWRIGAWSIVKNNTCKECPEFLPLTSVWLIQTSLHTLHNLSLIFYLQVIVQKKFLNFFFFLERDYLSDFIKVFTFFISHYIQKMRLSKQKIYLKANPTFYRIMGDRNCTFHPQLCG